MTRHVHELLKLCVFGKTAESFVFTFVRFRTSDSKSAQAGAFRYMT
jgi:hypothetical protein